MRCGLSSRLRLPDTLSKQQSKTDLRLTYSRGHQGIEESQHHMWQEGELLKGKVMAAPTTSSYRQLKVHQLWRALLYFWVSPVPTADREFWRTRMGLCSEGWVKKNGRLPLQLPKEQDSVVNWELCWCPKWVKSNSCRETTGIGGGGGNAAMSEAEP